MSNCHDQQNGDDKACDGKRKKCRQGAKGAAHGNLHSFFGCHSRQRRNPGHHIGKDQGSSIKYAVQKHGGIQTVCGLQQDAKNDPKDKRVAELLEIHMGKPEEQGRKQDSLDWVCFSHAGIYNTPENQFFYDSREKSRGNKDNSKTVG